VSIAVAIVAGLFIGLIAEYAMVRRRGRTESTVEELADFDRMTPFGVQNERR
jgi:ABC-type spermidine/putrescine transport system permease subunit II